MSDFILWRRRKAIELIKEQKNYKYKYKYKNNEKIKDDVPDTL